MTYIKQVIRIYFYKRHDHAIMVFITIATSDADLEAEARYFLMPASDE